MTERFTAPIETVEPLGNGVAYILKFTRDIHVAVCRGDAPAWPVVPRSAGVGEIQIIVHRLDLPKGYDPPAVGDVWQVEVNAHMEARPR